jgi:hypothetical protein
MTWTPDDAVFANLRNWLVEQGFVVLSDHYDPDHFGDQVVELARPIAVQLVRDRSEWGIFIAGADGGWLPLDRWVQAITNARGQVTTAGEQAEALRTFLPEIERRATGNREPDPRD